MRDEAADGGGWAAAEDIIRRLFGLSRCKSDDSDNNGGNTP
jgi:hypothetical protein